MWIEKQVDIIISELQYIKDNFISFIVILFFVFMLFLFLVFPFFSVMPNQKESVVKMSVWVTNIFSSLTLKIVFMILYVLFLGISVHIVHEGKRGIQNIQIINFAIASLVMVCQYIYTQKTLQIFYDFFSNNIFFMFVLVTMLLSITVIIIRPKKKSKLYELEDYEAEYIVNALKRCITTYNNQNQIDDAVRYAEFIEEKINKTLGAYYESQDGEGEL